MPLLSLWISSIVILRKKINECDIYQLSCNQVIIISSSAEIPGQQRSLPWKDFHILYLFTFSYIRAEAICLMVERGELEHFPSQFYCVDGAWHFSVNVSPLDKDWWLIVTNRHYHILSLERRLYIDSFSMAVFPERRIEDFEYKLWLLISIRNAR